MLPLLPLLLRKQRSWSSFATEEERRSTVSWHCTIRVSSLKNKSREGKDSLNLPARIPRKESNKINWNCSRTLVSMTKMVLFCKSWCVTSRFNKGRKYQDSFAYKISPLRRGLRTLLVGSHQQKVSPWCLLQNPRKKKIILLMVTVRRNRRSLTKNKKKGRYAQKKVEARSTKKSC